MAEGLKGQLFGWRWIPGKRIPKRNWLKVSGLFDRIVFSTLAYLCIEEFVMMWTVLGQEQCCWGNDMDVESVQIKLLRLAAKKSWRRPVAEPWWRKSRRSDV